MEFHHVPVGAIFSCNGNRCRKASTRTADILDLDHARRFYFGKREWCTLIGPEYRDSNPKIDLLAENDTHRSAYVASTTMFPTCRDALAYFGGKRINGRKVVKAVRA